MRNMKAVCSLQKKYDPATILAAVKSKHFENIYHIGLKAYGPRGWKYNQVAIEAIKRYNKEHQDFLKLCDKTAKEEVLEEQPDQEKLKHRTKQYSKKKNSINKLRDL